MIGIASPETTAHQTPRSASLDRHLGPVEVRNAGVDHLAGQEGIDVGPEPVRVGPSRCRGWPPRAVRWHGRAARDPLPGRCSKYEKPRLRPHVTSGYAAFHVPYLTRGSSRGSS